MQLYRIHPANKIVEIEQRVLVTSHGKPSNTRVGINFLVSRIDRAPRLLEGAESYRSQSDS